MSNTDALHTAVCQAVALLNVSPEVARAKEGREARDLLRQALIDYADSPTVAPADERATFESVIAQKWPHLDLLRRTDDDTYRDCVTDWLWQGWIVGRKTT